ncbi:MAG: class I SAM-dependent methyltransferase, partial [Sulfolobus sp.]|nr:class I SAM-dependent methyltransferase [Sulfolobus sp.]
LGKIEHIRKESAKMVPCGNKILDVGSGPGTYLAVIKDKCGKGFYVTLDINEDFLKAISDKDVEKIIASGDSLPFRDKAFDVTISAFMFRYLDHKRGLAEFARVSKKAFQILDFWKADNTLVYLLSLLYTSMIVPLQALIFSRGYIHDYLYIYRTIKSVCRENELFKMAEGYGKIQLKFWFFRIIFSLVISLEK